MEVYEGEKLGGLAAKLNTLPPPISSSCVGLGKKNLVGVPLAWGGEA